MTTPTQAQIEAAMTEEEIKCLMPAITLMERKVDDAERKVSELLAALNVLRVEAGMSPAIRALKAK